MAVAFFLSSSGVPAAEPSPSPKVRRAKPLPQVIFLVYENYVVLDRLKHPLDSACLLADRLLENGYGATLVTDSTSHHKLTAKFAGNDRVALWVADTPDEIMRQVIKWRSLVFETSETTTPFGFIVCAGHGESRRSSNFVRDYLMTPKDRSREGGVCIQDIADAFGAKSLPVVMFVDMCRTETGEVPERNPANAKYRSNPSAYDSIIAEGKGRTFNNRRNGFISPVLTFWSTQPGKLARDGGDFMSALADGMERMEGIFAARENRKTSPKTVRPSYSPLEGHRDLSLFTWFSYALEELNRQHGQGPIHSPGLVDPMMICASCRPEYVHAPPPLDIISTWNQFASTALTVRHTPHGIEFTRPLGADTSNLIAVSFFNQQAYGWQDKTLVVEATAEMAGQPAGKSVGCLLIPGNYGDGTSLRPDWAGQVHDIPYHKPKLTHLPLIGDSAQKFASMVISVPAHDLTLWPEEATIRISQMTLINNRDVEHLPDTAAVRTNPKLRGGKDQGEVVDLFPRCWLMESKAEQHAKVAARYIRSPADNSRTLNLKIEGNVPNEKAGRGGCLFRPPYVKKDDLQLKVTVSSVKAVRPDQKGDAVIVIEDEQGNLVVGTLAVPSGKKQYYFDFVKDGYPERINIMSTDVSEINISEMSLVPRR
jgi:hypothetical protein